MVMYAIGIPGGEARICEFPVADDLAAKVRPGEVAVEIDGWAEGRLSEDGTAFILHVPGLDELKAARREEAKRVRRKRIGQGITVAGIGAIQTDSGPGRDSLAAIERYASLASRHLDDDPAWSIDWTLADDSEATLDAAQMMAIGDAASAHEQACRAAANAIFTLIDAAEDEAALAAIDITAGYPPLP
nr:DUF4376 domain-containing protein [Sphingomonas sp. Y57]